MLVGTLATSKACSCSTCPILLVHGTNDTLNPISRVRNDAESSQFAHLVEIEQGGHSLTFSDDELKRLIKKAINIKPKTTQPRRPPPMFALLKQLQKKN